MEPLKSSGQNRLSNLKPFQPGRSGNPKGRPPGRRLVTELRDQLDQTIENGETQGALIVRKLVDLAIGGDLAAIKLIFDRIDGRAPMPITSELPDLSKMSDQELEAFSRRFIGMN